MASKLFACDIVRFSDAELDLYLECNGRLVEVEDPKNLSKDFILRLRMRAGSNETAQSHPVDLVDLTARLQDIRASRQAQHRSPSLYTTAIDMYASDFRSRETTESLDEEKDYRHDLARETKHWNTLIREGGRPSHPVILGRDVLEDPGEYREILSYWQLVNNDAEGRVWKVFGAQMGNWQDFRRWQRKNRDEGRFLKYVEGVKSGLAEHGFTRLFRLDEDPGRQDKLTTWIEYLDYEYWWYDKRIRFVNRHQSRYDEAWKKLVESKVLKTSETEEFIWDIDSSFQHAGEEHRAKRAVKSAKTALLLCQKAITHPRCSSISQREHQQRLKAAQYRLNRAVKSLESIKRRNDIVSEFRKKTKNYRINKKNAKSRSILLRWILEQVPLIELELKSLEMAENDFNGQKAAIEGPNAIVAMIGMRAEFQNGRKTVSLSVQPPATQDSSATTTRNVNARSARRSAPNTTRSGAKTLAKQILNGEVQLMNREGRGASNLSPSGSSPIRRSIRTRKPPDRFR